jgi:hypothetical protein
VWSSVLLTGAEAGAPSAFSSTVVVVPVGDPMLLVDAVGHAGVGHVVVAAPAALAGELSVAVTLAAGRWPDVRIATLVSPHAPLAVLGALLIARQATDQPAHGVRLAEAVLAASWSGAWLTSLAGLPEPAPTFGQYLRSYLPGAGFLVRQRPSARVLGRPGKHDVPPLDLDRVLLVQDGAVPPNVVRRLAGHPRVVSVQQIQVPGRWRSVYGREAGQLALLPARVDDVQRPITHRCPSCRLGQVQPLCPFCLVVDTRLPVMAGHR